MSAVIVDASIALKWVLPPETEPLAAEAWALQTAWQQGRITLEAPTLWLYECGNTLSRKMPSDASTILRMWLTSGIKLATPTPALLDSTHALVQRYRVTFYDASYHALALQRGGTFVTADTRYLDKAAAAGGVLHLKDWR
jgi:predicted nucleic acid-binding protein